MQPHVTVITLGVDDLERALAFYRDGLGLPTEGIVGTEFEPGDVVHYALSIRFPRLIPGATCGRNPRRIQHGCRLCPLPRGLAGDHDEPDR